jgi:hypothetical protein
MPNCTTQRETTERRLLTLTHTHTYIQCNFKISLRVTTCLLNMSTSLATVFAAGAHLAEGQREELTTGLMKDKMWV